MPFGTAKRVDRLRDFHGRPREPFGPTNSERRAGQGFRQPLALFVAFREKRLGPGGKQVQRMFSHEPLSGQSTTWKIPSKTKGP